MQKQILKLLFILTMFFMMPSFASADVNTIIADPNNVTECGTLNQPSTVYTLRNDVTSAGSCFSIIAPNITLDLNGFTATYDDGSPMVIPNGSFEIGTGSNADGWDFSSAPDMQRAAGVFVKPVSVYAGDYALKIPVPAADQQIRSVGQVTLEANTTYTISAMMYNNYYNGGWQSGAITLSVGLDDGTSNKTASKTGINWRGFQYTYKEFKTGNAPESYNVVAAITGASGVVAGNVFIDDIKIQKHYLSGIFVGPASWNPLRYPDVTRYGNANGAVIKSGAVGVTAKGGIIQGQGASSYSDAIYVAENSGADFDFNNLELTTHGANSHLIFSYNMNNGKISHNLLHHNVKTITSRDNYDGAAVYIAYGGDGGFIDNNILDKGVQTAIYAHTKVGAISQMQVHDNQITLQTRYTNDFAIVSGASKIFKNTINCGDGDNSCRGIGIGGNGTETYQNNINVQQLPRNQEYDGCCLAGAYGMQMESNTKNIKVYENIVNANADVCEAYALRANPYAEGGVLSFNNMIYDNVFTAIKNGPARAGAIKYSQLGADEININNNTFKTNDKWIYIDGGGVVNNPTFSSNKWESTGTLTNPFRPLEVYTWGGTYFSGAFYDNIYATPEDKIRFENDVFRTSDGNPEVNSSFNVASKYFNQSEILTFSIPNSTTGDTFYIDGVNGSDTYNGLAPTFTSGTTGPFKTIGKCFDRYRSNNLVGGDVVKIKTGIYRESIALQFTAPQISSLTESTPLKVGPYGDGEVIIDPSSTPQVWTAHDGNIFWADWTNATYSPQAVVMNNDFKGWRDKQNLSELTTSGLWFFDVAARKIYVNTGGIDPLTMDPVITYNNASAEQYAISTNGYPYLHFYGLTLRGAARYGLTDYPGSVGIKLENNTIKFNNGNGARIFGTQGVVKKNHVWGNMLYNWPRGRRWAANGGWGQGLTVGGYGLAEGNVVHDNGGEGMGVYGGTGHVVFQDNILYDNWSVGMYLDNAEYCTFQRNFVYANNPNVNEIVETWQLPQWIIDAGAGTISAETNKIIGRQRQEGIMAGDESATNPIAQSVGFKALNNIIIGARRGITTYGQATGAGLNNYVFAGNTIIMPSVAPTYGDYAGMTIYSSVNNVGSIIKNNIIYSNAPNGSTQPLVNFGSNSAMSGVDFNNNLYFSENSATPFKSGVYPSETLYSYANWKNYVPVGYDSSSIYANPLFLGLPGAFAKNDYRLSANSPAINFGATFPDSLNDFNDFNRVGLPDIGAFEYGSLYDAIAIDVVAPASPSGLSVL